MCWRVYVYVCAFVEPLIRLHVKHMQENLFVPILFLFFILIFSNESLKPQND